MENVFERMREELVEKIQILRKVGGMSYNEVADIFGVSSTTVKMWVSGRTQRIMRVHFRCKQLDKYLEEMNDYYKR